MTQSTLITEPGNGTLEIFALPTDAEFLQTLITDVFQNYWDQIHFGTAVQGGWLDTEPAYAAMVAAEAALLVPEWVPLKLEALIVPVAVILPEVLRLAALMLPVKASIYKERT